MLKKLEEIETKRLHRKAYLEQQTLKKKQEQGKSHVVALEGALGIQKQTRGDSSSGRGKSIAAQQEKPEPPAASVYKGNGGGKELQEEKRDTRLQDLDPSRRKGRRDKHDTTQDETDAKLLELEIAYEMEVQKAGLAQGHSVLDKAEKAQKTHTTPKKTQRLLDKARHKEDQKKRHRRLKIAQNQELANKGQRGKNHIETFDDVQVWFRGFKSVTHKHYIDKLEESIGSCYKLIPTLRTSLILYRVTMQLDTPQIHS